VGLCVGEGVCVCVGLCVGREFMYVCGGWGPSHVGEGVYVCGSMCEGGSLCVCGDCIVAAWGVIGGSYRVYCVCVCVCV
jgi:hypothetical protein